MGTARIEIGGVNLLLREPFARAQIGGVNLLMTETQRWEVFIWTDSEIEASLTVESVWPPLIGRWTWPIRERLIFHTQILQSHDRTEQRIAMRQGIAEHSVGTELFLESDNACSRLNSVLHTYLKLTWPVPLWFEAERHEGLLPAGSSSIAINTRYADFRENGMALIWQNPSWHELVPIETVEQDSLILSSETVNSFEGVKFIMPIRRGRCIEPSRVRRYCAAGLAELSWRIEDVQKITGFTPELVYDGYTVLTEPSYLASDHAESLHDPDIALLDGETGPFEIISNSDYNQIGQPHIWQPQTKEACWELRQFLHDVKGRQKAFLVPTFKRDLTLTRPVGPAETSIYVAHADLIQMGANDLRTYLAFRPAGLPIIVRKIMDISLVSDDEERIDISASTDKTFDMNESLCWVDKCRLAADDIEWRWYERGKATVETSLIRVTN